MSTQDFRHVSLRFATSVQVFTAFVALQHQEMTGCSEDVERVQECTCQADGCVSDLAQQSVWHQKSRICSLHMSGIFLKQGKAQQFCQQCGRSHNPDAFDKGRRSCRTQLAKHAARCNSNHNFSQPLFQSVVNSHTLRVHSVCYSCLIYLRLSLAQDSHSVVCVARLI